MIFIVLSLLTVKETCSQWRLFYVVCQSKSTTHPPLHTNSSNWIYARDDVAENNRKFIKNYPVIVISFHNLFILYIISTQWDYVMPQKFWVVVFPGSFQHSKLRFSKYCLLAATTQLIKMLREPSLGRFSWMFPVNPISNC